MGSRQSLPWNFREYLLENRLLKKSLLESKILENYYQRMEHSTFSSRPEYLHHFLQDSATSFWCLYAYLDFS